MGEPLTHPNLPRFLQLAKERGYKSIITTNGTLLGKMKDALLESGVYKVNISVHSFEEGSDEDYLSYLNSVFDFADISSKKGILTVLRLWNRGYDKGRNIDTLALLKRRFIDEWKEGERGARIRHRLHLEYGDRFDWPDMKAKKYGDKVFCHGLGDHFAILCDGSVVPCCLDAEGDMTLGNIFESDVRDILASPRAKAISEGFTKKTAAEELCRRCAYARRFKL